MTLATDSTKLRKGYGEKLLQGFFAWAQPRFSQIDLKVNEQNTAAINLYAKVGFTIVPERTQQWWYVQVNAT